MLDASTKSRILNPEMAKQLMITNLVSGKVLRLLLLVAIPAMLSCCLALGCSKSKTETDNQADQAAIEFVAPDPLKLLVVGDDQLGPRIKRQWAARQDGAITVVDLSVSDLISSDFRLPDDIDVLIYPPSMLGDLVPRQRLLEVPRDVWNSDQVNKNELLKHFRTLVVRHDNKNWALPLGSPCFSMICNRNLFQSAELEPPLMWEEMDRCLEKLDGVLKLNTDSKLEPKVDLALAPGWAAHTFLARAAPEIALRGRLSVVLDRRTMKPLIGLPPFVESLEQLKSIASQRSLKLDPQELYRLAASGESSIAVTWPAIGFAEEANQDSAEASDEQELEENPISMIVSLPGSDRWFDSRTKNWAKRSNDEQLQTDTIGYGGLIGSVSASSANDLTAWDFLSWLCSKKISLLTMTESPEVGPFRASHLGNVSRWTGESIPVDVADQFADVVAASHDRPQAIIFPRIPGHQKYFDALDEGVRKCVAGKLAAEEALEEVSKKWEEITEQLGRKPQVHNLKQATGL